MSGQAPASLRPPPRVARGEYRHFCSWQGVFPAAGGPNRLFCPWQLFSYRREQILVVLLPVCGFSFCRERKTAFLLLESCQKAMGKGIGKHRDGTGTSLIRHGVSQQPILAGWETTGWHWCHLKPPKRSPIAHFGWVGNNGPVPEVGERAILFPTESVFLFWERKTAQCRQT